MVRAMCSDHGGLCQSRLSGEITNGVVCVHTAIHVEDVAHGAVQTGGSEGSRAGSQGHRGAASQV